MNEKVDGGCHDYTQVVAPGKAVRPRDEGVTPEMLGMSEACFDMANRMIEWGTCRTAPNSAIGIQRFSAEDLSLDDYQARLREDLLPTACEPGETMMDVVWKSGADL